MFDTLAVAQQFAAGSVARDQAEVIAKASATASNRATTSLPTSSTLCGLEKRRPR